MSKDDNFTFVLGTISNSTISSGKNHKIYFPTNQNAPLTPSLEPFFWTLSKLL